MIRCCGKSQSNPLLTFTITHLPTKKWKDAFPFHLKCYLYKITRHCTETSLVCIYISKREKTFSGAQIYKQQKRMFEKTPIL